GAGVVGARLLALGRDDVAEETLHVVGRLRVVVGRAGDQVRRQQQRVGTRLGRLAVDLDREVAGRATVLQRRRLHRLRGARRGRLDVLRAGLDLHRGEVAGRAEVGVADRAVTLADRGDHAGGAVG